MKLKILFLTIIISFITYPSIRKASKVFHSKKIPQAKKNKIISEELIKAKFFFSAAIFAKEYLAETKKISEEFEEQLEFLVLITGSDSFENIDLEALTYLNSPTINILIAYRLFNKKKYKKVLTYINKIPKDHRFKAEADFMKGVIFTLENKLDKAIKIYESCKKRANRWEGKAENDELSKFYEKLKDSCQIHIARVLYKKRDYKGAIKAYDVIPKTNYQWPYLLIEKAWAHYYIKDYNRSLGLLFTYKSPLLSSYFLPGSDALSAISYFKLCLWTDAMDLINLYQGGYTKKSQALKTALLKHKKSNSFFLKLITSKKYKKSNKYISQLANQIGKRLKFQTEYNAYKKAMIEYKFVGARKSKFFKFLYRKLKDEVSFRKNNLNFYVKKNMFRFTNDIHRYSYEMFNIKLEVMSKKRKLVYADKKLISNRSRGSLENVNRHTGQYFYDFRGAFWADELGDYSFGLKSNCETIENEFSKQKKRQRRR